MNNHPTRARGVRRAAAVLLALLVAALMTACASTGDATRTPPTLNATWPGPDGVMGAGYLATPPGEGPHPAVLMIHEWWGLNEDVTLLADALAAEGFVVLAPDALRGELATSVRAAIALNSRTPAEQIAADIDAAYTFLRAHPAVDPARIASMGFCFGGRESMRLGVRAEGLAAVVTFYGSGLVTEPAEMGNLAVNGPLLGVFGADDRSIPLDEVAAFEAGLEAVGADASIHIFEGVGHAFVNSETFRTEGAAADAWALLVDFLADVL